MEGRRDLVAWEESWRGFRTAAIMLEMASSADLDRYASEFRQSVVDQVRPKKRFESIKRTSLFSDY